jgi:transposase-like protein
MDKHQRLQEWTARITDFKTSGLTMSAWCKAHDQTIHQLKYWLRKLNHFSSSKPSSTTWLPLAIASPPAQPSSPSSFLVRVGHAGIEVKPGFNPELLREIVRALEMPC